MYYFLIFINFKSHISGIFYFLIMAYMYILDCIYWDLITET